MTDSIQGRFVLSCSSEVSELKIFTVSVAPHPLAAAIPPGIYPYLGGLLIPAAAVRRERLR